MNPITEQPSWNFAIQAAELQENSPILVAPKGLPVLLIKEDGQIYALSNKCAHMGCGLEAGVVSDGTIQCPCHDWRYDLRTGEFLTAREIKVPIYELKIADGKIYINIQEGGRS